MAARSLLVPTLILLATFAPFPGLLGPAEAGGSAIQPGDFVVVGSAGCTLNFVYDGVGPLAGRVYLGTGAHCVGSVGQSASTTGVSDFGHVAFIRSACCAALDYAFIEVKPQYESLVVPDVRGHPGFPNGYTTTTETGPGDVVYISGYGMGFNANAILRHQRVGVLVSDSATTYVLEGPVIFGDSGGPLTHASGQALGIVSRIVVGVVPPVYDTGPTIEGVLADAAAQGFPVELRTAS